MRVVESVQRRCSDEPEDVTSKIVIGALLFGKFPVDRLQQARCLGLC